MFIPINAKADIIDSKKGKLTPAQNAQLNAWTLTKKTGIFNIAEDFRCKARASTPISNVVTVTFDRGFFVVCGRLVEVEQNSAITIPLPASGIQEGHIIASFDHSLSQEAEFRVYATTAALIQEDLNLNPNGRYDFPLYRYTAYSANNGNKVELHEITSNLIDSVATRLSNIQFGETGVLHANKAITADTAFAYALAGDNGSYSINAKFLEIDEKLEKAGFIEGSVTGISGATLTKMGKYAILSIPTAWQVKVSGKATMSFTALSTTKHHISGSVVQGTGHADIIITISGKEISWSTGSSYYGAIAYGASIGFEIKEW